MTQEEIKSFTRLESEDKAVIAAMHLAANAYFKNIWKDGITDNYAGTPIYEDNNVVDAEPVFNNGKYIFPLLDNAEVFIEHGVITVEQLKEFGV